MYSVVLATMLTAGGQATTFCHHRHWCHGCHTVYYSCHVSCHSFCSCSCSWWCHGGSGCYCSSCHCCNAYVVVLGSWCHGCSTCSCSCWCSCSCAAWCHGCTSTVAAQPSQDRPSTDGPRTDEERKAVEELLKRLRESKKDKTPRENEAATPGTKARLIVSVPADARLWVDSVECPLPGPTRTFETPQLNPELTY
ncbi:MAG: hypothetical protein NZO58_07260, partial [Gemmataceae bacterium]|nr:hypothetical protein [Gemmataceae bacterium]